MTSPDHSPHPSPARRGASPRDGRGGERVTQRAGEPLPEPPAGLSGQLAEQLGGWRGLIESSIPVIVFVIANVVTDLRAAVLVAVACGVLIAVFRRARRQPIRHAVNGLVGVGIGAVVAWRSGEARDLHLPGIIITAGYVLAMVVSIVVRWPLVGWVWSIVLDKGRTRWREDPVLLRTFGWLTGLWTLIHVAKVGVQSGLYLANEDQWLGVARIALGWPPYALLLAVTIWAARRVTRHQNDTGTAASPATSPAVSPVASPVHCYQVAGRTSGTGPVVAVLTDGPTDPAVAATAAAWAAHTRTLLVVAVAVADTGSSINALLDEVRGRRYTEESVAVVDRVTPVLTGVGVAWIRTIMTVPAGADPTRTLPLTLPPTAVGRLVDRFDAVGVVTATALHDPTGHLRPITTNGTAAPPATPAVAASKSVR